MKKFAVWLLKCVAAFFGPACMLYSEKLFDRYFASGRQTPDEVHFVPLNNHGVYRYITEAQDQHFRIFIGLAVVWVLCLFVVIYVTKFRK